MGEPRPSDSPLRHGLALGAVFLAGCMCTRYATVWTAVFFGAAGAVVDGLLRGYLPLPPPAPMMRKTVRLVPSTFTRAGRLAARTRRDMLTVARALNMSGSYWAQYTTVWIRTPLAADRFDLALDALVEGGDAEVDQRTFNQYDKPAVTVAWYRLTEQGRATLSALESY